MIPPVHPPNSDSAPVFISYSRADIDFAKRLAADLQRAGVTVWIDQIGLQPGTPDWEDALRSAIRVGRGVILVATPESRKSRYVRAEIAIAEMETKPVYPVWADGEKWEDSIPMSLYVTQNIDARGEKYAAAVESIIRQIQTHPVESAPVAAPIKALLELRNPYKGLNAFRKEDRADFYGREALIGDMSAALNAFPNFLAVIGASGSGKSSVLMAGLLPKLEVDHPNWTFLPPMLPDDRPVRTLAEAISGAMPAKSVFTIGDELEHASTTGLASLARQMVLGKLGARVVLYIDQFEEVFTRIPKEREDERRKFINLLTTAANDPACPLMILLSMRADFWDRPLGYPLLGELMTTHSTHLLPMSLEELKQAVTAPAENVGLAFDDGLVGDLIFEVRGKDGALPLLQFTLNELYLRRADRRLTRAAYDTLGGVSGALAQRAEAIYAELPTDEHRRLTRALFIRLIAPGATEREIVRRRAALSELTLPDPAQTAIQRETAEAFVKGRLLITNRIADVDTIELSHEALIGAWTRLTDWLNQARPDFDIQRNVTEATSYWIERGRQPDDPGLMRGSVLREKQDWAARSIPNADELAFIEASAAYEKMQIEAEARREQELIKTAERAERATAVAKRQRRLANVIGVIALGIGILSLILLTAAFSQLGEAHTQADQVTGTLGYVQDQGETVAAQSTYFGIAQARIGTLAAGAVVLPISTLTPDVFLPQLTEVAQALRWQPHIVKDDQGVEMVEVPPGCFLMGSVGGGDEQPIIQQCFSESFYIDRYEVTNGQYQRIMGEAPPSRFTGDNRPVESITWFESRDFCAKRDARLPTEVEWEYAARGPDSLAYPWGDTWNGDNAVWYDNSSESADVGSKPNGASWVGALDMSGNVWEWIASLYEPYPYIADGSRELDDGNSTSVRRVVRGGSWVGSGAYLRGASRYWLLIVNTSYYDGFRCARSYNPET